MKQEFIPIPLIYDNSLNTYGITNVLLIHDEIKNADTFYNSTNSNTYPIIYSNNSIQIDLTKLLNEKFPNGFDRLSIIFHDPGYDRFIPFLNNTCLFDDIDLETDLSNISDLSNNAIFLINLIQNKNINHIDFLSCNTLSYPKWESFYNKLQNKTNSIVGASLDKTGNIRYGSNWIMENTNEDIKNIYFTNAIDNYNGTLGITTINASGILLIKQDISTNPISYSVNNGTNWIDISNTEYPVYINNTDSSNTFLQVKFTTNITIHSSIGQNGTFIPNTQKITFDGSNNTITINGVTNYKGFILNGDNTNNGKNYINVTKFKTFSTNTTFYEIFNFATYNASSILSGLFFGKHSNNNYISYCSNSANINSIAQGGICGPFSGYGGTLTISNCSNTGNIMNNINGLSYAGGICGSWCGYQGNLTIFDCSNSGTINGIGAGGICGIECGNESINLNVYNCSNSGTIYMTKFAGGIGGYSFGAYSNNTNVYNCFNTGDICGNITNDTNHDNGGIFGSFCAYGCKIFNMTNCYSTGNVYSYACGGLFGANFGNPSGSGDNVNLTISKCYFTGNITSYTQYNNDTRNCGAFFASLNYFTSIFSNYPFTYSFNINNCFTLNSRAGFSRQISSLVGYFIYQVFTYYITYSNIYIEDGTWNDASANSILSGIPSLGNGYVGSAWTKLYGTNIPYVLSNYNSSLYDPSYNTMTSIYSFTSGQGLFQSDYSYNIISILQNANSYTGNSITINSSNGILNFNNLSLSLYKVNVISTKYTNGFPYNYNINSLSLNIFSYPSLSGFSISNKTYGDPSFSLVDPSSNSSGSFTFSSSNTNVATITNVRTINITGAGTSVITATQDICGNYLTKDISTNLIVSKALPTLTNFPNITKNYKYAKFILTDPSSNSSGAFTYTSTSNNVAPITGNIVNIITFGTSIITATQAETSNYLSRDISAIFISEACFSKNTPIQTDQGIAFIQDLDINKHTINNKKIIAISKTTSPSKSLICFEKNSLSQNVPTEKTIMSKNHQVFYEGKMTKAKDFLNKFKNVYKISNKENEILYNILLNEYTTINVNGLICETLHPENIIAQIYQNLSKLNSEEQNTFVHLINDYATKNNVNIRMT